MRELAIICASVLAGSQRTTAVTEQLTEPRKDPENEVEATTEG